MKSSPLFKVIFTLVRGNAWKAGTYGNMEVDKQEKIDDRQHPSIDLHVLSLGTCQEPLVASCARNLCDRHAPNLEIFFIVNDIFEAVVLKMKQNVASSIENSTEAQPRMEAEKASAGKQRKVYSIAFVFSLLRCSRIRVEFEKTESSSLLAGNRL